MKTFKQLLQQRTSVSRYQAGNPLDASVIEDLIEQATLAPSAYNLQNWRFIAVSSDGQKHALHQAAYQQPQILDAATTIIVIGTLNAHQALPEVLQLSVDAGIMPDTSLRVGSQRLRARTSTTLRCNVTKRFAVLQWQQ